MACSVLHAGHQRRATVATAQDAMLRGHHLPSGTFMKTYPSIRRAASVVGVALIATLAMAQPSAAATSLAGKWQMAISGNTGCGLTSMLVNVTLDASGFGNNAVVKSHGQCGNAVVTGQTFQILSITGRTAKANLSCGPGCGWNLDVQIAPGYAVFNLADVDPVNPGNFIAGTAVRQ